RFTYQSTSLCFLSVLCGSRFPNLLSLCGPNHPIAQSPDHSMPSLDHKPQGEMAELCFLCRATTLGLTVSKPYGDSARYDFVVDAGAGLLRVQVKSVSVMRRNDYRIAASSGSKCLQKRKELKITESGFRKSLY